MKEIIQEIYSFIENPGEVPEEWAVDLGHQIAQTLRNRFAENERTHIGLSDIGKGNRYLWYKGRPEIKREPLHPAAQIKFMYGDIIELFFLALIKLVGHEVTDQQKTVYLEGMPGHIDGRVDGKKMDVKSASSIGFTKFENDTLHLDDKFGYYWQLEAYAEAENDPEPPAGWFVMDKSLGHLCFTEFQPQYAPDARQRAREIPIIVAQEKEPDFCYQPVAEGKSGNMKLATQCSYCEYKFTCWRDANMGRGIRTFIYSKGPVYLVKVVNEPKVQEVFDAGS